MTPTQPAAAPSPSPSLVEAARNPLVAQWLAMHEGKTYRDAGATSAVVEVVRQALKAIDAAPAPAAASEAEIEAWRKERIQPVRRPAAPAPATPRSRLHDLPHDGTSTGADEEYLEQMFSAPATPASWDERLRALRAGIEFMPGEPPLWTSVHRDTIRKEIDKLLADAPDPAAELRRQLGEAQTERDEALVEAGQWKVKHNEAREELAAAREAAAEVDRAGGDAPHEPCMGLAAWIRCRAEIDRRELAAARKLARDEVPHLQDVLAELDGCVFDREWIAARDSLRQRISVLSASEPAAAEPPEADSKRAVRHPTASMVQCNYDSDFFPSEVVKALDELDDRLAKVERREIARGGA